LILLFFFVKSLRLLNLFISRIHRAKLTFVYDATVMVDFIAAESADKGLEVSDFGLSHDFILLLI
jgi:hypothetical protein